MGTAADSNQEPADGFRDADVSRGSREHHDMDRYLNSQDEQLAAQSDVHAGGSFGIEPIVTRAEREGFRRSVNCDLAQESLVPRGRIELPTLRFSVVCSTN